MIAILSFVLLLFVGGSISNAELSIATPFEHQNVTLLGNVSIAGAYRVIYIDFRNVNWNNPEQTVLAAVTTGFNVVILAFYLSGSGAADMALAWQGVPAATKQSTMQAVHSRGAVVLVSMGGATDSPYGRDPSSLGQQVGNWARTNYLDGVDFDLEDLQPGCRAGSMTAAQTVSWMVTVSSSARSAVGSNAVITHAPQAPYFGRVGDSASWAGSTGCYTGVYQGATFINFFNAQFYNQGASCYTTYAGLFQTACSTFPGTAVTQITSYGIPNAKVVVGKPVTSGDASNGWIAGATLGQWFRQGQSSYSWGAGYMGWQWGDQSTLSNWVNSINF